MKNIIALVPDAYGGRGGMAVYLTNFLNALSQSSYVDRVICVPREVPLQINDLPDNVEYLVKGAESKFEYVKASLSLLLKTQNVGLIVCGHLNLLPLAFLLAFFHRSKVLPICYGADAWTPTRHFLSNVLARHITSFVSIRKLTARRFKGWAKIPEAKFHYLKNSIDLERFSAGPKRDDLVNQLGLQGSKVIMTSGRMDKTERFKGFDEVIQALPLILEVMPQVKYVVMGDGEDQARLEEKARRLGVLGSVVFLGYVSEDEKPDFYNLADVVAMPGSDPVYFDTYPFRFSFLEPLALGIPVVGTRLIDDEEASDPLAQALVIQVDPNDNDDVAKGILKGLSLENFDPSDLMREFSMEVYNRGVHNILSEELENVQ